MALQIAIKIEPRHHQWGSASSFKKRNKGTRELKRLDCSINYDSKGESSTCGKGKNKGLVVFF